MAGMIGMAQTLGVYHYGYFTLKGRDIQYHGPTNYPLVTDVPYWTGDYRYPLLPKINRPLLLP